MKDFVKTPEVSVVHVEPIAISFQEITLEMELKVYNPNPVGIPMTAYDYDFLIDGHTFIKGQKDEPANLKAYDSSTIKVPVNINYKDFYKAAGAFSKGTESPYTIVSGLVFELPVLGPRRLELKHEGTLPHVKVPRFGFKTLKITDLSLFGAEVLVVLDMTNANGFDVKLKSLEGAFRVNGKPWVSLSDTGAVALAPGEKGELAFRFKLNLKDLGRTVYILLKGKGEVHYDLDGGILLGTSLPLLEEARLPLFMSGKTLME